MDDNVIFFRKHLKSDGGVESFIKHLMQVGQQNVHTPFALCREIVGKLQECTKLHDKRIAVLFNVEFLHVLIDHYGINPANIVMFADDDVEFEFCQLQYKMTPKINLFHIDMEKTLDSFKDEADVSLYTKEGKCVVKFDVTVGNPPYQAPKEMQGPKKGTIGGDLWSKFIPLAFEITKEGGYVCLVHPASWRKPEHKLLDLMKSKSIKYLEMHNKKDGQRVFGASTNYDWYVAKNSSGDGIVQIKDDSGKMHKIDITNCPFIPSSAFDLITPILAKPGEETCEVLFSRSAYGTDKKNMSNTQDDNFQHPCVHSLYQDGSVVYWYSNTKENGFFGVPKVILNFNEFLYPILDFDGEFGLTQIAFGLKISSKKEGEKVKKAIESDKFKEIVKATKWSVFQTDWRMFKYFRRDFWKEFV